MVRSLRHVLLILALSVGATHACAQRGGRPVVVLDSLDDRPISEVALLVGGRIGAITDAEGRAVVELPDAPLDIVLRHVAYGEQRRRWTPGERLSEGAWVVRLLPRSILLPSANVERAKPEAVFQRKDLHAADLLINEEGLWVLAYEHPRMLRTQGDAGKEILRDVRLVLLDTLFNELASCPVPEDVYGLRHDLRNTVLIEGTEHAFSVERGAGVLELRPFGLDDLRHAVLPWTDSIPGWVVGTRTNEGYPAVDHLAHAPLLDSTAVICSVVDTFMMDLFRSTYKYLKGPEKVQAMTLADELGVDKETVAGYMGGFQHNIWYRPVYAPLFVVGDTLLVFDQVRARMRKFTRDLVPVGEAPLPYLARQERRDRVERIMQDRKAQGLYAVYARYGATWVRPIDPVTGALGDRFRITNGYPERVQAHEGYLYYISRPYGSLQKRTIYRERMP